jgi:hypothetical protein
VDQPKYSWFHRTALTGGYVCRYDPTTRKWVERVDFAPIDTEEDREDIVLARGQHLYMLVYSAREKFAYRQLLQWNREKSGWTEMPLEVSFVFNNPSLTHILTDKHAAAS